VPKLGTRAGGAFGLLNKTKIQLQKELEHAYRSVRRVTSHSPQGGIGSKNLKRLRSRFSHAMACDVIYQPVGWYESDRKIWKDNPMWDLAPRGAYYKAKRLCSLLNDIVIHADKCRPLHDLERLSINIWTMSRRSFDGLCRRIRSKIYKSIKDLTTTCVVEETSRPEATDALGMLTVNPPYGRVMWRTRRRKSGRKSREIDSCLLSTNVDVVRYAHKRLALRASKAQVVNSTRRSAM